MRSGLLPAASDEDGGEGADEVGAVVGADALEVDADEIGGPPDESSSLVRLSVRVPASRCCSSCAAELASGIVTPNAQMSDCKVSLFLGISKARVRVTPED